MCPSHSKNEKAGGGGRGAALDSSKVAKEPRKQQPSLVLAFFVHLVMAQPSWQLY